MGMIKAYRLSTSLLGGTMSAAQLETAVTTGGQAGDFLRLISQRSQIKLIAASSVALAAVVGSSTASAILAGVPEALQAVFDFSPVARSTLLESATGMASVASSAIGMAYIATSASLMAAMLASANARLALWGSDVALSAIAASATALAAIRAAPGFAVIILGTSSLVATNFLAFTGKRIVVGWSTSAAGGTATLTGRRPGSTVGTLVGTPPIDATGSGTNVIAMEEPVTLKPSNSTARNWYLATLPV